MTCARASSTERPSARGWRSVEIAFFSHLDTGSTDWVEKHFVYQDMGCRGLWFADTTHRRHDNYVSAHSHKLADFPSVLHETTIVTSTGDAPWKVCVVISTRWLTRRVNISTTKIPMMPCFPRIAFGLDNFRKRLFRCRGGSGTGAASGMRSFEKTHHFRIHVSSRFRFGLRVPLLQGMLVCRRLFSCEVARCFFHTECMSSSDTSMSKSYLVPYSRRVHPHQSAT